MAAVTDETRKFLQNVNDDKPWWNELYSPGETVPHSGIYRCVNCGKEITSNEYDPFPPQNDHQHPKNESIKWQLIIRTDTKGNRFTS